MMLTSRHPLNPLAAPRGRFERISEILCLMHDLALAKLHDAHGVRWSTLVGDDVFGDPEIACPENSLDLESGGLTGMMTAQGLQIFSPENSFAGLRIVADSIVHVDIVFCIDVAGCRRGPMCVQGIADLLLLRGLLRLLCGAHRDVPRGMKPGLPVCTTSLSLCLIWMRLISSSASSGI